MYLRLLELLFSSYRIAELKTIGFGSFILKPFFIIQRNLRLWRSYLKKLTSVPSLTEIDFNSPLLGKWLYGSNSNLELKELEISKKNSLKRAELARKGLYRIYGKDIDINLPPFNGRRDVDIESGSRWKTESIFSKTKEVKGNIRIPWELGRLHQLIYFAQAYRYTRDTKWLEFAITDTQKFFNEVPFEQGVHWHDGLQVSVRVFSLIAFADLTHDAPSELKIKEFINNLLFEHSFTLKRQLSPPSSITNNHIIGELSALILLSIYFENHKDLQKYLSKLKKELDKQLYSDGVPYEGSLPYIRFDLDFLLFIILALRNLDLHQPKWLLDKTRNLANSLSLLSTRKGEIPPIGDGDDSRVLRLDEEEYLNVNESLIFASNLLNNSYAPSDSFNEFSYWAIGPNKKQNIVNKQKCIHLEESGLIHMHYENTDIWMDCGPTGLGQNGPGGHGHNDTTSIVLYSGEERLLHDPGWYGYFVDDKTRDYFRSTLSHNCISINKEEQARLRSRFFIENECLPNKTKIVKVNDRSFIVETGHNGFKRIHDSIKYSRKVSIEFSERVILRTTDIVESEIELEVSSRLGSDFNWIPKEDYYQISKSSLKFLEKPESINIKSKQYSVESGVLFEGSSLEWKIKNSSNSKNIFYYSCSWELEVT